MLQLISNEIKLNQTKKSNVFNSVYAATDYTNKPHQMLSETP